MRLPDQIPQELRQNACSLPGPWGEEEGAWCRADALTVIGSLEGTTIPVSDVTPYRSIAWGTEIHWSVCDPVWSVHRMHNESDINYARRSRKEAAAFIAEYEDGSDELLFALTFPTWKDAA